MKAVEIGSKKKGRMQISKADKTFDIIVYTITFLLILIALYPVYFVVIASFSTTDAVNTGKVILWPAGFSLNSYKYLLEYDPMWIGYRNTILYTIGDVIISLFVNVTAGFALSRKELPGGKWIRLLYIIPMFIGGGMIPKYIVVQKVGLIDNPLAVILPSVVAVYNIVVIRNFFSNSIPEELWDASRMDGCGIIQYFSKVVLPLSKAILAVIGLWTAVGQWNSYFSAMLYLSDDNLISLQLAMRNLLVESGAELETGLNYAEYSRRIQSMKYSAIVVSSIPVMCLYPFVQKYFNQGIMVGSVKG